MSAEEKLTLYDEIARRADFKKKIYMIIYLLFSSSPILVNTKIIGKRCFQPIFVNYRQYTNANYYQNSIVWNK